MEMKKFLVPFLAVIVAVFLVATVSADQITSDAYVYVNDQVVAHYTYDYSTGAEILTLPNYIVEVDAGEMANIEIEFVVVDDGNPDTGPMWDRDVTFEAEIEGDKDRVNAVSNGFVVEEGTNPASKKLTLKVPYELEDDLSYLVDLNVELDGRDHKTEIRDIPLRVMRPSYNIDIMSVNVPQYVDAGENFPVDVVLRNIGYLELDSLYVTVSVSELGVIQGPVYFGSLEALDEVCTFGCNDDDDNEVFGRINLEMPYGVQAGSYTLEVKVYNDDMTLSEVKTISVDNDFTDNVIVTDLSKNVDVGEEAEYEILLINPTNKLKVYRIVTESSGDLYSDSSASIIAVPAGSSRSVMILAEADSNGNYNFDVNIFAGESLVKTVTLSLNAEGSSRNFDNSIVILTIVLAVIFIVLLIVLIVLLGKKPEKSEEFSESYY